jgi:Right handed beta helix region
MTLMSVAAARAQPPIPLTSCSTKITKTGLYEVNPPGLSSTGGDCLTISASNVILYLNGFPISGAGNGVGVHILSSASNAFVEGHNAVISGFAEGVEIDGSKDLAENFIAESNSDAGVLLNNAKQAKLSNFSADSNGADGVRLYKGSYNTVAGSISASYNARYGIWLYGTSHDSVGGFEVQDNTIAGVYVGCSSTGPSANGSECSPKKMLSKYNSLFSGTLAASGPGLQPYGVVIDLGDDFNRVTNMNGSPFETGGDLVDENANCANNDWFGEEQVFLTVPPSPGGCIP